MVMEAYGVCITEAEIRAASNCDVGTFPSDLVQAAIFFGFHRAQKYRPKTKPPEIFEELQALLLQGCFPIVYVREWPHLAWHAVVILEILETEVLLLDPSCGERIIKQNQFEEAWTRALRELILIQR